MSALVAELGTRFAERWAAMLVLPGLIFVVGAAAARYLGHAHWSDVRLLAEPLRSATTSGSTGWLAVAVLLPLASFLAALAARALAGFVERWWFGLWPAVLRPLARGLTGARERRWRAADQACDSASSDDLDSLAARRNAIALVPPTRPTWMGDRLDAVDRRVWGSYKLDVVFVWPRLWLVLNDSEQLALRSARERLDTAVGLAGWGLMCLLPAFWWWPAAVIGVLLFAIGHRSARGATDGFAHLAEAVFDLRGALLARELGFAVPDGRLEPPVGVQVTQLLRKGV